LRNLLISLLLDAQSRNLKTHKARVLEESVVNLLRSEINQIAIEVRITELASQVSLINYAILIMHDACEK